MKPRKLTFTTYLRAQSGRDDPIGDFARDWCSDHTRRHRLFRGLRGRPRGGFHVFRPIRRYLESRSACAECIEAAEEAFVAWRLALALAQQVD